MQQLASNTIPSKKWRSNLFETIREEGIDLTLADKQVVKEENVDSEEVCITEDNIHPEIAFWNSSIVCHV